MNKLNPNIKVIKTKKYKDINLYLRFSFYTRDKVPETFALLSKLIGETTILYPTKTQISKVRDMLYGINLDISSKYRSNIATLTFHYSFINPKFVDVSIDEYVAYIKETLFNSIINNKTLKEAKTNVCASILRNLDKPNNYALQRFTEIISKDNDDYKYLSRDSKFISNIKKISLKELKDLYSEVINSAMLHIYVCGDLDDDSIYALSDFNFKNRIKVKLEYKKALYPEKKMIVDKLDMGQSILYSVYKTPFNKKSKDFFAWFVANTFLGNVPISLLFSEVREKMSLCYSIGVIDYKYDGLVRIATYIDACNYETVLNQIDKQKKRILNKDYDLDKLEMSKLLLCDNIASINDDLDALVDYYYESLISRFNYSIDEYIENIMKVNSDDLIRVFKKYEHYFDYLLLGTGK